MSLDDIRMSSNDLIDKEQLDAGGFGMVSLCFHRIHGLVVTKTVYTGSKHVAYNGALLEEGKIMHRLNHERIVKLLGLILEDGNYSLVMEYMKKGNLLTVLQQVQVSLSVKGRFMLEIIEGMTYLHEQNVVHKDLKPENVLLDDNFHIKIADLGVATFKSWSKLTKEETDNKRKRSISNVQTKNNNAGTLIYMAPEHLKSLHARSTEKSDVFSFGIVIWIILTDKEPYENALNNEQIHLCVINGDRPNLDALPEDSPPEAIDMMRKCWEQQPEDRPTFKECDKLFRPFYISKQEKNIEKDVAKLKLEFPKPRAFIERMASLQLDCDAAPPSIQRQDQPQSLHSSQGLLSQSLLDESLFFPGSNEPVESEEPKTEDNLERKLQQEMMYHQMGSRIDNGTSLPLSQAASADMRSKRVFSEFNEASGMHTSEGIQDSMFVPETPANPSAPFNYVATMPHTDIYGADSRPEFQPQAAHPHNMYTAPSRSFGGQNDHFGKTGPGQYVQGMDAYWHQGDARSLPFFGPHKPPIPESGIPDLFPHLGGIPNTSIFQKGNFGYSPHLKTNDNAVSVSILNSTAVQIGNNNHMTIEKPPVIPNLHGLSSSKSCYEECGILNSTVLVNENHLELLRENLATKWKHFARKLGFRNPEIEEIDHDYDRDGLKEKVYQTLYKWKMREGSKNTTVGKVATALHAMGENELLNEFLAIEQN